ncbi:NAD(P)-binding protein [Mollisia scopiformis]|uniref:NAD(P)-binding protein n=1 Tax=Mollisia scopiformis TaxID=149040 RepID=A0A132B5P6_MOLSC|nr:NAD(P)-binding protein [Mollisia scopiformis]KUJ07722.1 NAD(P)-binding protein [Mollisia scopiformis]
MKLIITGATGFVGKEAVRQALHNPAVSSVVVLARKPLPQDTPGLDEGNAKLQWVVLEDWTSPYSETVREHVMNADACIWSLAVTPSKSREMDFAYVTKICSDYTINGLKNMAAVANKPFRFVYVSGVTIERDQSKSLTFLADYRLMRGRVENELLEFAEQHKPNVQVTVAKPGGIEGPGVAISTAAMQAVFALFGDTPTIHVSELAAALIDQCLNGITEDPLWAKELVRIGKRVLRDDGGL